MSIHDLWKDFVAIKKDIPFFIANEIFPIKKKILVNCFYFLKLLYVLFHNGNKPAGTLSFLLDIY